MLLKGMGNSTGAVNRWLAPHAVPIPGLNERIQLPKATYYVPPSHRISRIDNKVWRQRAEERLAA